MDLAPPGPYPIDFAYDAVAAGIPVGVGYTARTAPLLGIVVHSTNGPRGSTFAAEAAFIRDSRDIKAHYLVGQDGRITRILDPGPWVAWHAGASAYGGLTDLNAGTVGIECHHAVGDPWPLVQLAALAAVCRALRADHTTIQWVVAHRQVALPPGRKTDPDDLSDEWLAGFVAAL